MPPKKRVAAPVVPQPAKRASGRTRRAPVRLDDTEPLPQDLSAGARDPVTLMNALREQVESQVNDMAAELANLDVNIQSTTQRLDELIALVQGLQPAVAPGLGPVGTSQGPLLPLLPPSQDVLSQWHWLAPSVVESIANSTFDIYDLPKLHRDQTLRDRHIQKNVEGVLQPLSGGKPILLHAKTKLQSSFPDLATLLSAWLIYVSTRIAFAPERGPGLLIWTERLVGYHRLHYEFTTVIDYIVAYFQKHQKSPPEKWFEMDSELHTEHLGNAAQKALAKAASQVSSPTKSSSKPAASQSSGARPMTEQICHAWNRSVGCQIKERTGKECVRRHVCGKCQSSEHTSLSCSKRAS